MLRSGWIILLIAAMAGGQSDAEKDRAKLLKQFRDEFVAITPGKAKMPEKFTMGRDGQGSSDFERPAHEVSLGYEFSIARYETTQALWEAVMGGNPSRWKGKRNAVEMISYYDAVEFCKQATKLLHEAKLIADDESLQLPTEAEWEYCARAGTTTVYSFGDDAKSLGDYAWFTGNAAGNDPPVGAKKPNPWKLYDMHGYLSEWCCDEWTDSYDLTKEDARGKKVRREEKYIRRALRGGSWKDAADRLTSSYRTWASEETKNDATGLRCVLVKSKVQAQRVSTVRK
jgi:formylglycine-generating enzyme required for sulfatase activity